LAGVKASLARLATFSQDLTRCGSVGRRWRRTQNIDQDLSVKLLFSPEASRQLASGLAKDLYEIALWTIAVFSYMYYRAYVDGAGSRHPWVVAVAGWNKLGATALVVSWYAQGRATPLLLLLGAVPELLMGLYIVKKWRDSGSRLVAQDGGDGDKSAASVAPTSTNPNTAPGNWVFAFASAHAFLIVVPSLLLSLTGVRYRKLEATASRLYRTRLRSTQRVLPSFFVPRTPTRMSA
jgi:hypothetical protein